MFNGICGDKFSYSDIKSHFDALSDCFWNEPISGEKTDGEIVLFGRSENKNSNITRVKDGWMHIYTGCGNHLVVKEMYYSIFVNLHQNTNIPVKFIATGILI